MAFPRIQDPDPAAPHAGVDVRYVRSSVRPALERLFATLEEGELVLDAVTGTFSFEPGYLVVTDRRVVFGMEVPFLRFINRTVKVPHEIVTGVEVERRPWGARIRVTAPNVRAVIGGLEPHRADALAELIRRCAELPDAGDGQGGPRQPSLFVAESGSSTTDEQGQSEAAPPGWYTNPTGPGQRYWDGQEWADSYAPEPQDVASQRRPRSITAERGTPALVVAGYVFAVLIPLVGFILGIVAVTRPDQRTSRHGVWIIVASVIAFVIYTAIVSSQGP